MQECEISWSTPDAGVAFASRDKTAAFEFPAPLEEPRDVTGGSCAEDQEKDDDKGAEKDG